MDDVLKPLADKFSGILEAIIAEKTAALNIESALPLQLTAKQCMTMLGIGNYQEFQRISSLPGFPKIDKGKGAQIRYPRDEVRNWYSKNWKTIGD